MTTNIPSALPLIYVDGVLLEELFTNLLENAAKYSGSGTPIEIAAVENGQNIAVFVRDQGPGFPPGDEARVFEKFFRGRTDGVRGVGLGLPICRAIVQRHRGTISAKNRTGGGAIVTIELPVGDAPPAIAAVPQNLVS